jgi:tetratricopeptide (TPR) repeat protein
MLSKIGNMLYHRGDLDGRARRLQRINAREARHERAGEGEALEGHPRRHRHLHRLRRSQRRIGRRAVARRSLTVRDQLNFYRQSILYAGHELGLGRLDYKDKQFDSARKHFENVLDATDGDLPFVGKLGQTRRFRTAARTSLGDVAFEQGVTKTPRSSTTEAFKGAKADGRLDLMWPAQRGTGRSLWRGPPPSATRRRPAKLRDEALASYREALARLRRYARAACAPTSRARPSSRRPERSSKRPRARSPRWRLLSRRAPRPHCRTSPPRRAARRQALAYATEALAVAERGRARSLLDMLSEAGGEITEGVPAELREKKRENLRDSRRSRRSDGRESRRRRVEGRARRRGEELNSLQSEYESIENQIRTASPRYAALTSPRTLTLEEIRGQVLDEQTALLEYSLGEERSYLFAVTRAG